MKKIIVDAKHNYKKLDKYLFDIFPGLKASAYFKALRKKDIQINGKRVSENVMLQENDEITLYIPDEQLTFHQDLSIIYEDDNILVINKPIGIEVEGENSLTSLAQNYCGFSTLPCHRLDRNTSRSYSIC